MGQTKVDDIWQADGNNAGGKGMQARCGRGAPPDGRWVLVKPDGLVMGSGDHLMGACDNAVSGCGGSPGTVDPALDLFYVRRGPVPQDALSVRCRGKGEHGG